ncbi:MAG TPA: ABC transporter permease [Pirellulaceae bacterium]|nr:ABC transporter permease [Pirellulaceae bacterium]HMP69660.1 ABC transporter permease [Pirellulaceae bacterium]
MRAIASIAWKDIRLLLSDKMAAFFVLGFPILMGLFFGSMMTIGGSGSQSKMKVALVDLDQSEYSRALSSNLGKSDGLILEPEDGLEEARQSVQGGKRTGMIVIPQGFGEKAGLFWEEQKSIQVGIDPARSAEGAMLEGLVMEAMAGLFGQRFAEPTSFLQPIRQSLDDVRKNETLEAERKGKLETMFDTFIEFIDSLEDVQNDSSGESENERSGAPNFQLASIERLDVTRMIDPTSREGQLKKVRKGWDISFPQAMLWGVLGCAAGFAISLAQERENGTLMRLQIAPISRGQILAGKALACFLSILFVVVLMTIVGLMLGMRPLSYPKLIVAAILVAICFVGIMMTLSTLGKSVQSVSGTGWAANMIMAMLGGCMIPVIFMPEFIAKLSVFSPVRWAILSLEGAIWRDFSWLQLGWHGMILFGFGLAGLLVGVWNSRRNS